MEFALTACYEKYVVDDEILGMVMRAVEGVNVNEDTIAFDLIKEVGPGGNFVTAKHTRHYMRREHYQPLLSDRDSRDDWTANGAKDTWQRAAQRVNEILAGDGHGLPGDVRARVLAEIPGIAD
jgi:trimethylamine--corrinoid protein Co-methyltransferase